MRIQHNIMAMNAYRNYSNNTSALSKNLERLSSGYKINRAGDDAAGLAISEKMRAQITGLEAAQKNVKDGTSLVNTAEGAMQEIQDMLNRMVYLATQSANGTYDNEVDRANLQKEVESLKTEINRIADSANFNGIKLLDGKRLSGQLSVLPVEYETISTVDGINVESSAGKGTKGSFSVDLKSLHGTGDTITFAGTGADGTSSINITLTYSADTTDSTHFTGGTVDEQAQSIKQALEMNGNIAAGFDVSVEGSKVTLTAKTEGTENAAKITSIKSTDATVKLGSDTPTAGVAGTVNFEGGWDGLFSADGTATSVNGVNVQVGDKLTFNLKGANGEDLTTTIEITADMLGTDGKVSTLTTNVVEKLKNATFDDIAGTGIDESKIKVSDLFNITANMKGSDGTTANDGGLFFEAINGGLHEATNMELKRDGVTISTVASQNPKTAGASTAAVAENHVVAKDANAGNFSAGDVFKISGKLSDGQEFSVNLVAGEDFAIGASYDATMTNIVTALTTGANARGEAGKVKVDVDGQKVDVDKIFGTNTATASTHDFKVSASSGALTIESTKAGAEGVKGVTGDITSISVKAMPAAESVYTAEAATAQQSASASISFDKSTPYGTAIQIGDNTYEIVSDARNVTDRRNIAVVIDDIANASTASIAQAVADAVTKEDGTGDDAKFAVTMQGNTVTINTIDKGSNVAAIDVTFPYGDEITTAKFQFDPKAVSEGATLKFNGNTYEFVSKGGKASSSDAIAIHVDDFKNATSKSLGDAFAAVVKGGVADVAADGTVSLKSLPDGDGVISTPSVTFANNLTLQIGDTSDSYNQLRVNLSDMHTTAMGIDSLNIGSQEGAQAAIDVIRNAINYVSGVRGDLGAISNRLDHTANNLSVMRENITDAESNIRDTDIAEEMMAYTKNNILVQSAQAMLAQANQVPQGVLQLLQ